MKKRYKQSEVNAKLYNAIVKNFDECYGLPRHIGFNTVYNLFVYGCTAGQRHNAEQYLLKRGLLEHSTQVSGYYYVPDPRDLVLKKVAKC